MRKNKIAIITYVPIVFNVWFNIKSPKNTASQYKYFPPSLQTQKTHEINLFNFWPRLNTPHTYIFHFFHTRACCVVLLLGYLQILAKLKKIQPAPDLPYFSKHRGSKQVRQQNGEDRYGLIGCFIVLSYKKIIFLSLLLFLLVPSLSIVIFKVDMPSFPLNMSGPSWISTNTTL